jgi:hypothetical protein
MHTNSETVTSSSVTWLKVGVLAVEEAMCGIAMVNMFPFGI